MSELRVICQYDGTIRNAASWMTGLFSIGEIEVSSVGDLVKQVRAELAGSKVTRLEICAHGSDTSISIGEQDLLHSYTPKRHMPALSPLAKCFTRDGYVVLWVCEAGKLRNVLAELAKTLGVSIYANTGTVNPVAVQANGQFVVARPNGRFEVDCENVFWVQGDDSGAWF
jgi:Domain of unknown function (DUF4347)